MKTNILPVLILFCLFFAPGRSVAQDENYDAYYFSVRKEYTLNPDGSMDYRYRKEEKLLSYRAFQTLYGETFVVYHPGFQKLKINEAYTMMADGKKVVAPANSFNEVLPAFAASAPAYNALREMVITHTGLERNATVTLDYTIHTDKGVFPALMGNEMLAEAEPAQHLQVSVRIPAGRSLNYKVLNAEIKPEITTEGAFSVYTWKLSDVASTAYEEAQQGGNERYPRLVFSTSGNREEIYSCLTGQEAFKFACSKEMTSAVNGWLADKKEKFEKVLKVQEKVVGDLKLYPVPLKYALYRVHTPEQTWNENGGTPVEKAVLLVSLLKASGIEAQVVAVTRSAFAGDKVATLADIEDFAVKVEFRDRGTWYFSVSGLNSANMKLTLPGRFFIALLPGGKSSIFMTEPPAHMVKVIGNFIVSSDPRITGEVSLYFEGGIYPYAALARDKWRMRNTLSGNLVGSDSVNLKVSTLNLENGFQTYTVLNNKPFRKDSNFYYFPLPVVTTGIENWGIKTLSQKRETPYEIPAIADESYAYTFTLPEKMVCFTPNRKLKVSNKAGKFVWEVSEENGKLTVRRQLQFSSRVFSAKDYSDFKILFDYWNNPWYRQVILMSDK